MKQIKLIITLTIAVALTSACNDQYGDDLRSLGRRVEILERDFTQINEDIRALQAIATTVESNGYVTRLDKNSDSTYTVTFNNGNVVTLRNGRVGQDGIDGRDGRETTLLVSIRQDTDNMFYWTVNGEWLLDDNDQKVRAGAVDGKDGKDGKDGLDGKNGKDGADGKDGLNGLDGHDGKDGLDGQDGRNGHDGRNGRDGINGRDGRDGQDGRDGLDGTDGIDGKNTSVYPTVRINEDTRMWEISMDFGATWASTGISGYGKDGANGRDGRDGQDGQDGKDGADGADGQPDKFVSVTVSDDGTYLVITVSDEPATFRIPILQE